MSRESGTRGRAIAQGSKLKDQRAGSRDQGSGVRGKGERGRGKK